MARAQRWLAHHPSRWVVLLEAVVRALNVLLVAAGLAVAGWALATFIQIQVAQPAPPPPSPTPGRWLLAQPPHSASAAHPLPLPLSDLRGVDCPWFVYAFGAVGLATAAAGGAALASAALRSVAWANANVVAMCLVLAAQACVGVAAWLDHSWERRLPDADEAAKRWLAQRLSVVKWTALGLAVAQLATLLLGCGLQSAYTAAEEAAEDDEDDAAWRRRPLLRGGAPGGTPPGVGVATGRRRGATPPLPSSSGAGPSGRTTPSVGAGPGAEAAEEAAWQARMRERYGLDPSQFGGGAAAPGRAARRPRARAQDPAGDDGDDDSDAGAGRGCVVA